MGNYKITIEPEALKTMCKHAEETFPYECCGFMYGFENPGRRITHALSVENSKDGDQRRRFEISPFEYMKAESFALENNIQLLGVYHSHPNHPAIASEHDLAVAMPYFSYVIISVIDRKKADIKSWQLKEGKREFAEELVETENEASLTV